MKRYNGLVIVLGLLLFNNIVGFIQENNASNSVEALRKKLQINVKLLRLLVQLSSQLVPGIMFLIMLIVCIL